MKRTYSVYKITNTKNGMLYIGSSALLPSWRWVQHKAAAKAGRSTPLYSAIREYGVEHFTFEVVREYRGRTVRSP